MLTEIAQMLIFSDQDAASRAVPRLQHFARWSFLRYWSMVQTLSLRFIVELIRIGWR